MTFTKLFSSITESTVWAESSDIRIVWITMLAMANYRGEVMASVPGLAYRARVPVSVTEEALVKFMAPDPWSRTKDYDGRRIEEVDGGWRLLNYKKHRENKEPIDAEKRKAYQRDWVWNKRNVDRNCVDVDTEVDVEVDTDKEKPKVKSIVHFVHPTLQEVAEYCNSRNNKVDPQQWMDYYASNGWKVGRNSMKDWRAAVRNWEKNERQKHDSHKTTAELRNERSRQAIERAFGRAQGQGA